MNRLSHLPFKTIFDVGANRGDWSLIAGKNFPGAHIHAFEIVPATYLHLEAAVRDTVTANAFGLSSVEGPIEVNYFPDNDLVSSAYTMERMRNIASTTVSSFVCRGDTYCRRHQISSIDFLKIDVEGAEHLVLDGFGEMFDEGRIGMVQFEYGMANIYSRHLLYDFWKEFGARGYRVGKLMPNYVAFKDWSPEDEDFRGPNYIAVHRSRADILTSLIA